MVVKLVVCVTDTVEDLVSLAVDVAVTDCDVVALLDTVVLPVNDPVDVADALALDDTVDVAVPEAELVAVADTVLEAV